MPWPASGRIDVNEEIKILTVVEDVPAELSHLKVDTNSWSDIGLVSDETLFTGP
jgi:hypothetical protein